MRRALLIAAPLVACALIAALMFGSSCNRRPPGAPLEDYQYGVWGHHVTDADGKWLVLGEVRIPYKPDHAFIFVPSPSPLWRVNVDAVDYPIVVQYTENTEAKLDEPGQVKVTGVWRVKDGESLCTKPE